LNYFGDFVFIDLGHTRLFSEVLVDELFFFWLNVGHFAALKQYLRAVINIFVKGQT
jgi:hypothetical protein